MVDEPSGPLRQNDAKCVTISVGASASYCIDTKTGVLLEISAKDPSGKELTSFTVTKFEEPSDSDFTPPATPGTIPGT